MFPESFTFSIADWVNGWVDSLVTNYGDVFRHISDTLLWAIVNLEGLLRGDSAARASFYQQMLSNGVMTINEVRALENLPPVEGGDVPRMQSQYVPITQAGSLTPTGSFAPSEPPK